MQRPRLRAALVAGALVLASCSESSELSLPRSSADETTTTTRTTERTGEPGAAGAGDPYFPQLGNGGYDVRRYDLDIEWLADRGDIVAEATITLEATADISSLNLDLVGLEVSTVTVDGDHATFERDGRELTVDLPVVLEDGAGAIVVVSYSGAPEPVAFGTKVFRVGWQTRGREAFVVSEPAGAATWFPANDHPTDKATFRYEITAPADLEVIANGTRTSMEPTATNPVGATATWVYESHDLMATYLASVVIADLVFYESTSPAGVPLRSAYPAPLADQARADFAMTGEMLAVFEDWFGPYPFEVYGHVVVDQRLGFALENQTLSLFGSDLVTGLGPAEPVVAHELAHQWFGNAVSLESWRDIWLNEGFATYAEWVWEQESGGRTVAASAAQAHALADYGVPPGAPGPDELFQPTVYVRGALVLHALSVEIGQEAFRELLHEWASRHDDSTVSTEGLRRLAEEISGVDLGAFFARWVYGEDLPPLP